MRTRLSVTFLVVALVVPAACVAPAPAGLSDADLDALSAMTQEFGANLLAGDGEAMSMMYTEDAVLMPPGSPAVRGRSAIRDVLGAFPPLTGVTVTNDRVDGNGDLAYVHGHYVLEFAVDGFAPDSGSYLDIRRRQADGSWKFVADMFNHDVAPPVAPAD
ncbi:MAG: DUF4440 domain-containing protein [Gemmatimonadota bacterium]